MKLISCQKTQNDYLREWKLHRDNYLLELLSLEAGPDNNSCPSCLQDQASFRCYDCISSAAICQGCCLKIHCAQPFHRIEKWTGLFWQASDLDTIGIVLHFGHHGLPCPSPPGAGVPFPTEDSDEEENEPEQLLGTRKRTDVNVIGNKSRMVFVSSTGVHVRTASWCCCSEAATRDLQLFRMSFFPSSYLKPGTAFTFEVLDHFYMDAMECKTSASSFFFEIDKVFQ
jgi:CxC2 like cysteine cluster associated with KDZ transposases